MNLLQVTPFLHVPDLAKAVAFFEGILGFQTTFRVPGYAYVGRGPVGFRLMEDKQAAPGTRRFAYYVDVANVDALYAELKPRLATLPPADVHGPADKPYGQRELIVLAPDGNLLVFGQTLAENPAGTRA